MRRARVVVVGSANTDVTVCADHLPRPGETVLGGEAVWAGGGKGSNQAVAAARAGAEVTFVGRVGVDDLGRRTRQRMEADGICTDHLHADEHAPSGVALIIVDEDGENLIAVAPGANSRLSAEDVRQARDAIAAADMVLTQLEVPLETVAAVVRVCAEESVPVMLNPAPARDLPADLIASLDYMTPNAGEAARLTGSSEEAEPEQAARRLAEMGVGAVALTLGAEGTCVCAEGSCWRLAPPPVQAVDTVAAGDCFCGVLAVGLGEGMPLRRAAAMATCAAAISVQRAGAQPSLPTREEIDGLLEELEEEAAL
ncbi:MAG: ribokinase [Candidatus Brocadiia bacterium]